MTTRSRFPQRPRSYRIWLLALPVAAFVYAHAPGTYPLLKSCGAGSETVARVASSDPVQIRYSFATDRGTCYAVTATVDGKTMNGYLAGERNSDGGTEEPHPAIIAFEHDILMHPPQAPAPPPPAPPPAPKAAAPATVAAKEAPPEAPLPLSFAGFRAVDIKGNRVDLSSTRSPNVVVYFWSALDQRGIKKAEDMDHIYQQFHSRGVDVVGIASARNATQLRQVCGDQEVVWSQILDSGGIAKRYHVNPASPYLVLDQNRKVIAAAGSPLGLEPILGSLTQRRRVSQ